VELLLVDVCTLVVVRITHVKQILDNLVLRLACYELLLERFFYSGAAENAQTLWVDVVPIAVKGLLLQLFKSRV
jgi:hypothetical protein